MIEDLIIEKLTEALPVPCHMMRPETAPAEYVLVQRTGGGLSNTISTATVAVQSYAGELLRAAEINELVKAAMLDLIRSDALVRVKLAADTEFVDVATKTPRYQSTFNITYYKEEV